MRYSFFSLPYSRREAGGHADRISGTQQQFPEHPDSDPLVLDVPDTAGETTAQPGGAAQIVDGQRTCVVSLCHHFQLYFLCIPFCISEFDKRRF